MIIRSQRKSEKYMEIVTTITLVIVEKNQKSNVRHTKRTISYRKVVTLPNPDGIHRKKAKNANTRPVDAGTSGTKKPEQYDTVAHSRIWR